MPKIIMNIELDTFLTAERLGEATKNNPAFAVIKEINLIKADKLPFESSKDRYELSLDIDGEEKKWLANKTSLKSLQKVFGIDSENWVDKKIKLWVVEQMVQGKTKEVVFAEAE